MKETIKKSFLWGIVFSLTTITAIVVYAAIGSTWTSPDTQEAWSWDTLTSASWNKLQANFNNHDSKIISLTTDYNNLITSISSLSSSATTPTWAIMWFYLSSCPTWWVAADGTNSTPDLRWAFIRWMWWNINSRDVVRTLWDYQVDDFKSHTHWWVPARQSEPTRAGHTVAAGYRLTERSLWSNTTATWWTETRPKNIALLYCMKQ